LRELDNPSLTKDERALLRCRVAADFIHKGQYEAAREALGEHWLGIGKRPNLEGLDEATAAEVLLQVGSLSGWVGASSQVMGAQEAAKDLISESINLYESIKEIEKAATARSELALCYWREGAYDDARIHLERASSELPGTDKEQKARVLSRWVTVEYSSGRLNDALNILREYAHLLDGSENHALLGSFHNLRALVLRRLGMVEGHVDYFDRAIIEYTASVHHYKLARHERYGASIENNLAFLLYKLGRYRQAHEHLDRAGAALRKLNDTGLLAQVDETRARVLVAEKKYQEARRVIDRAVQALEQGGTVALLAEALTTQGVVLARLGDYEGSISTLRRSIEIAEWAGASSNAGLAALALIEEHGGRRALPEKELHQLYLRADRLLKETQDAEDAVRLRACARVVMRRLAGVDLHEKNFTFHGAVHEFEAKLIEQALEEAGGVVTRAAKILGISHQTFTSMLERRHKRLQAKRTPRERRLRSIIKEPKD